MSGSDATNQCVETLIDADLPSTSNGWPGSGRRPPNSDLARVTTANSVTPVRCAVSVFAATQRREGFWRNSALPGRSLQLHNVAFGIRHVDRRALPFCSVAGLDGARLQTMLLQVRDDCLAIERLNLQTEMVHVAAFAPRRSPALLPGSAIHRHQVDQRRACAQLPQPDL